MTERTAIFMRCLNPDPLGCDSREWVVEATYEGVEGITPRPILKMDESCPGCDEDGLRDEWGPVKPDTKIEFSPGHPFIPKKLVSEAS